MRCNYCGSHVHTLENCPKTWGGQANRNRMRCGYCGSKKHNTNACPKRFVSSGLLRWHPEKLEDDFIKD